MSQLSNVKNVREILNRHGFSFSKKLGQNFIVNPSVCPRIAELGGAGPDTGVLEIGPGLGVAGPTSNFAAFSDFSKVVMTMDMLLGRLEVFPMLMLFYPPLWKESIGEARIRRNRSPFH